MQTSLSDALDRSAGIFQRYPSIRLAYLYGSQVTGQATPLSDVDIAIVLDKPLPARERLRLELRLETDLADYCGGEFDVHVINEAPLAVKGRVVQTGKILYARDDAARIAFETATRRAYFDFLPVLEKLRRAYFAAQGEELQRRGLL